MKLVELLAKNLEAWAGTTGFYVQDPCGTIYPCVSTPYWNGAWCGEVGFIDQNDEAISTDLDLSSDHDTAIVTREMWQAERDRQKGGEWKRHRGGKCPVPVGTKVSTRHRDGEVVDVHFHTAMTGSGPATMNAIWKHTGDGHDIMAYKIISQPQAEEVPMIADGDTREYKGPFPCAPEGEPVTELEWDIQFPSGVCSVQAKTEQMETPFKWRDEVTELNAYIEKYTRERDALIERLASEGFALIPPVVSVVSEFSGDSIPLKDWMIGDIVEVISTETFADNGLRAGDQLPIVDTDSRDGTVKTVLGSWGDEDNYKFIRRP